MVKRSRKPLDVEDEMDRLWTKACENLFLAQKRHQREVGDIMDKYRFQLSLLLHRGEGK